ncbi:2'-5' RNA ligase family protein [Gemmatimonas sp.]|uniref:2'-5' RNA ligase family protein n=1 Tax=Gemmatimonas sp. TaxID=1962908 RepID=UPI0027BAAD24|nr:2'-5' RNA ligase family protein [Gemmatimonas sp.]
MAASFGIFVLAELPGEAGAAVRAIQEQYDPKLARLTPPHVTLVGSSGVGAIPTDTPVAHIRAALEPIAASTAPMRLPLHAPHRFMQTDIISLPLDPNGPLRALHERIARSGLPFKRSRFLFSPHCTLTFYPTLTPKRERELLAMRVTAPAIIDTLQVYLTRDPQPSSLLFSLPLAGSAAAVSSASRDAASGTSPSRA